MKTVSLSLFLGIAITTSQGCTAYLARPVTVHVRDAETKEPISNAKLTCSHSTLIDFGLLFVPDAGSTKVSNSKGESVFWIDPYKWSLCFKFEKDGYQSEGYHYSNSKALKVVPRKWYQWKNDLYLDVYTLPEATLELVVPDGYQGPVVLRFANVDHPPKVRGQRHFTYVVPKNGVVDIQETTLLSGNYSQKDILTLRFQSDKQIHTLNSVKDSYGKVIDPHGPVIHEIHLCWKENIKVFCVGSKADASDMQKKLEDRFEVWEQSGQHTKFDVMKELQFR